MITIKAVSKKIKECDMNDLEIRLAKCEQKVAELSDALETITKTMEGSLRVVCPVCKGHPYHRDQWGETYGCCRSCKGSGTLVVYNDNSKKAE
jgi:hypothetical protein